MNCPLPLTAALTLAALVGPVRADEAASGREVYEQRCRTCHGGTRADLPIGPSLTGILGAKAGTQPSGVHSRALIDSGIVWDRQTLRRFLLDPARSLMPDRIVDPAQVDALLDYLESLR